jgi:hypothetical protein
MLADMIRTRSSRPQAYAGPRLIRFLAGAVVAVGLVAAVFGVAYAINGATHTKAEVAVPVELAPASSGDLRPTGVRLSEPALPDGSWREAAQDELTLRAWDSTLVEQLLARGDAAVLGLSVGFGAFLLRRLLLSTAEGRPFEPGNARRIATIAVLVAAGGTLAAVLPDIAGILVLDRLGQTGPGSPFVVGVGFPLMPVLVAPLVLALAEAFRRGAELAADVDGLV